MQSSAYCACVTVKRVSRTVGSVDTWESGRVGYPSSDRLSAVECGVRSEEKRKKEEGRGGGRGRRVWGKQNESWLGANEGRRPDASGGVLLWEEASWQLHGWCEKRPSARLAETRRDETVTARRGQRWRRRQVPKRPCDCAQRDPVNPGRRRDPREGGGRHPRERWEGGRRDERGMWLILARREGVRRVLTKRSQYEPGLPLTGLVRSQGAGASAQRAEITG